MKISLSVAVIFLNISVVWAAQISDDFGREDTAFSTDGSKVGENWVNSGENLWKISGGSLETDLKVSPSILYNNELQVGDAFAASIDVAALVYGGLVFNYQNPNNYYELRFKAGTKAVHLQCLVDGVAENLLMDNAAATFVAETMYTLSVTSGSPHHFDISIAEAGGSTVLYSATDVVDVNGRHTQGSAGAYATSGDARFDNFKMALVANRSLCFTIKNFLPKMPTISRLSAAVHEPFHRRRLPS